MREGKREGEGGKRKERERGRGREVFSIYHTTTSIKHTFGTARPSARVALALV